MKTKLSSIFFSLLLSVSLIAQTPEKIELEVEGQTRTYLKYVPQNLNENQPTLLLVAMHGIGGKSSDFFDSYQIESVANELNAIVIAPQALAEQNQNPPQALSSMFPKFLEAAWGCGMKITATLPVLGGIDIDFEFNETIDDEIFIDTIIKKTQVDYPEIITQNTFLIGLSMGGFMAQQYAMKYNNVGGIIAAVASMGLNIDQLNEETAAIPICMINGFDDDFVSYTGSLGVLGSSIPLCQPIDDVVAYWKARNNTGEIAQNTEFPKKANENSATKYVYGNLENEVVFYKTYKVTHTEYLSSSAGDCLDYNTEIKNFILRHSTLRTSIEEPVIDLNTATILSVSVYNLLGKKLFEQKGDIDLRSIKLPAKGVCIMRINTTQGTVVQKLCL